MPAIAATRSLPLPVLTSSFNSDSLKQVRGQIRDFHPLVFFYAFGFVATLAGLVLGGVEIAYRIAGYDVSRDVTKLSATATCSFSM